ncbi:MAG: hypothetical protein KJN62_04180 [Deltaproteobacteria bacterium]|nr:hypothetical protein [Deltaproteobacteria bacterium]
MYDPVERFDRIKKSVTATVPQEKTILRRRIYTTDRQIDRLVYEVYDLMEEDIRIVEESGQ